MDSMSCFIRVAVFMGEHVILLEADLSDDPVPEGSVGLPGTLLAPGDSEMAALERALSVLGIRGTALSPQFVDRIFTSVDEFNKELTLLYACDFYGYFIGTGAKPDKLPSNIFLAHIPMIEKVIAWRKAKGWG